MNSLDEKTIYLIWSGKNHMSDARQNSVLTLRRRSGCNVTVVTPENISEFNSLTRPIHRYYEKLSLTHRSDYLRSYLLYHYGGGYSDIKPFDYDWTPFFNKLKNSKYSFTGARETSPLHIASDDQNIINSYHKLVTMQRLIFKPRTEFALNWLDKVEEEIDKNAEALIKRDGSYHPRAVYGGVHQDNAIKIIGDQYPFSWNQLCGKILHELCYKNIGVFSCDLPQINFMEAQYR